jgi:phage replication initiation protein
MFGYQEGVQFFVRLDDGAHHHVGRLDFGGGHHKGRARLDLSGSACGRVLDWQPFVTWAGQQCDYTLTRVDLAVDCLEGEFSVDDAKEWLLAGEFNAGGRNPRHSTPGDWLSPTPTYGRTLEVGRRTNGKMLRAYEKGLQLAPGSGEKWTRFEVELRNVDRDLPLDVLLECDKYFVGAYKCLQRILAVAGERIATHQKEGEISMHELSEHCSVSYGRLINTLRTRLDAAQILDFLSLPGVPRRLEKASLAGFTTAVDPAAYIRE